MKILIAGDFFVSDNFRGKSLLDDSILNLFDSADFRILNLEAPITRFKEYPKIVKTGPHLQMSSEVVIPLLKKMKINAVAMANNHIMDYGGGGLGDSIQILDSSKIKHVGAGVDMKTASRPLLFFGGGQKICFLNFCENEWSIGRRNYPGANPLDIIENSKLIKEAAKMHDKVVVIIHGGHEYYHLPSPRMQKQYRFYADQGASLIVGHHTHCIGGYEEYKGVPIIYSTGNFLFTIPNSNLEWYKGFVLEVDFSNNPLSLRFHPIEQDKKSFKLRILKNSEKKRFERQFAGLNATIQDEEKINSNWDQYTEEQKGRYLQFWSPFLSIGNRYFRFLVRKTFGCKIPNRIAALYLNLMRCEAHRDLSIEVLAKNLNQRNSLDLRYSPSSAFDRRNRRS